MSYVLAWLLVVGWLNHGDFFKLVRLVKVRHFGYLLLRITLFRVMFFGRLANLFGVRIDRIISKSNFGFQKFKRPFPNNLVSFFWWYDNMLFCRFVLNIWGKIKVIKLVLWILLLSLEPGIFNLEISEPVGRHRVYLILSHIMVNVLVDRFILIFHRKGLLLCLMIVIKCLMVGLGLWIFIDFDHPVDKFHKDLLILEQVVKRELLNPCLLMDGVVRLDMFQ